MKVVCFSYIILVFCYINITWSHKFLNTQYLLLYVGICVICIYLVLEMYVCLWLYIWMYVLTFINENTSILVKIAPECVMTVSVVMNLHCSVNICGKLLSLRLMMFIVYIIIFVYKDSIYSVVLFILCTLWVWLIPLYN